MNRTQTAHAWKLVVLVSMLVLLISIAPRPHIVQQTLHNAQLSIQRGANQQAAQHIGKVAEYIPWRMDLWEEAAHQALVAGDPELAIQYLEKNSQSRSSNIYYPDSRLSQQGWVDLGTAYYRIGEITQAIESWQKALDEGPSTSDPHEKLAGVYIELGDFESAVEELQDLTSLNPDDAKLQYQLGLLLSVVRPAEAPQHLQKAAEMDAQYAPQAERIRRGILQAGLSEDDSHSKLLIGQSLASIGEWQLAAATFQKATDANPNYAETWAYLGNARQQIAAQSGATLPAFTDPVDGLAEIQMALSIDPQSLAANTFLAHYWRWRQRYDLALEAMETAVSLRPAEPTWLVDLGELLAISGDLEAASQAYWQAVALAPKDQSYLHHLAHFSLQYNYQVNEIALPVARRAVVMKPDDPQNLDLIAQVLIQNGDLFSAERFLLKALSIDDQYAPAFLHLGLIYALQGETVEARKQFYLARSLSTEPYIIEQADRLMRTFMP